MWDDFLHEHPDKVLDSSNGDIACDSYHKYKEDVALLKELGAQFYRFSISWPRILPNGTVQNVNQPGVDYYLNLLKVCYPEEVIAGWSSYTGLHSYSRRTTLNQS